MASERIRDFLDRLAIRYAMIGRAADHSEPAVESASVSARQIAKVVIVWLNQRLAMVVVPSTMEVNLDSLRRVTGVRSVRLAEEAEYVSHFPDCRLDSIPPFGNLFGMETLVDRSMSDEDLIAFAAGNRAADMIVMSFTDYQRAARPSLVQVAVDPIGPGSRIGARRSSPWTQTQALPPAPIHV